MPKFSTIIAAPNNKGYDIPPDISVQMKTPLEDWELQYAALAHAISTREHRYVEVSEPLAYYFAAIRGTVTDVIHPYLKRANEVFRGCDIKSKSAVEFEYNNRANGNRGTIKFNNNEIDIIDFVNAMRFDSV